MTEIEVALHGHIGLASQFGTQNPLLWSCRTCGSENYGLDPKVCRRCCRLHGHEELGYCFQESFQVQPLGVTSMLS